MLINDRTKTRIKRFLYLRQALELVWHSSPRLTLTSLGLLLAQGFLPLLSLYLTKLFIDTVTTGLETKSDVWRQIVILLVLGAIIALFTDLCQAWSGVVSEAQSQIVTDNVQNLLHAKSIEVDLEYYENALYYDALHRAQAQAPYRPPLVLNGVIQVVRSLIGLGALALLLFSLHWSLIAILFIALLPSLGVRLKYADQLYRKWKEWTPQERLADYLSWLLTQEAYAQEIRLFNLGSHLQAEFSHLRTNIRSEKIALAHQRSLAEVITQWSGTVAVFGVSGFIAYQTLQGEISLGGLVMYYQAFQRGQSLLGETLSGLASLYENSLFLLNFSEFMALKAKVVENPYPRPLSLPLQFGIQFHQVRFHYPHSKRSVLEEINLTIYPGETVAIVGENGAGKTSLIKLLCRLYDPTEGYITWDGIDLREFSLSDLREQISVVFQDYVHYNLTVKENIGFGQLELLQQEGKIKQAASQAGVDSVIARLPYGYETTLGHEFAEGEELSIGEWQKIAIARAFLRQAPIIILDEPTSALDPQSEAEVLSKFRELAATRTAILISHRLSTVKLADRIFVLKDGKIIESGTHEELILLQGTYAHLFATQVQHYP